MPLANLRFAPKVKLVNKTIAENFPECFPQIVANGLYHSHGWTNIHQDTFQWKENNLTMAEKCLLTLLNDSSSSS